VAHLFNGPKMSPVHRTLKLLVTTEREFEKAQEAASRRVMRRIMAT
jgi:hypothetical protein